MGIGDFIDAGGFLNPMKAYKDLDDQMVDEAKKEKKKAEQERKQREKEKKEAAAEEAAREAAKKESDEDRKRSNQGQSRRATILTGAAGLQSGSSGGTVNRRTLLGG